MKFNRNLIITILLISSSVIGIATLQKPLIDQDKFLTIDEIYQEEKNSSNKLALIKRIPTFGFDNLIASWLFLDFVAYYGNAEHRDITGYSVVPEYYELITIRDPRYVNSYFT